MMIIPDEFRVNHRAASESLLKAAAIESDHKTICAELNKARFFEKEALSSVTTPRQRALGMGLLHAVDLMEAVTHTEFGIQP